MVTSRNIKHFDTVQIRDIKRYAAELSLRGITSIAKIHEVVAVIEGLEPALRMEILIPRSKPLKMVLLRAVMYNLLAYHGFGSSIIGNLFCRDHSSIIHCLRTYDFDNKIFWDVHAKSNHDINYAYRMYCKCIDVLENTERDRKCKFTGVKPSEALRKFYEPHIGQPAKVYQSQGLRHNNDSYKVCAISAVPAGDHCSVSYTV